MIFAVFFFYKTLNYYLRKKLALLFAYIFGLYPGALLFLPEILTETFSIFIVCAFIYYFNSIFQYKIKLKNILFASFFLSSLILTKAIFGYVLIVLIVITSIYLLFINKKKKIKITLLVFCLSLHILPSVFNLHLYFNRESFLFSFQRRRYFILDDNTICK